MTALWIILGIVAIIAAIWLYLFMPAQAAPEQRALFEGRCYAHRGLHNNDAGVPENSLAAFRAAMEKGYGCELDVQFTKDKQVVVFHDDDLRRSSGVDKQVWELTYDELREIPLFGTDERIPLFTDVLATVAGQNPLIVEVKAAKRTTAWYHELCAATMAILHDYSGDYCVESFHPTVVQWMRKNEPSIVRGQLVTGKKDSGKLNPAIKFALDHYLTNLMTRPHFIALREDNINPDLRIAQKLGAMTVMWTVRDPERHAQLCKTEDAIIFEHYEPATHYTK